MSSPRGRYTTRVLASLPGALTGLLALAASTPLAAQPACPRGTLPAYAHNDYENARPLSDALTLGFRGVEADVFLIDGVLRVGHDGRAARRGGSLEALYLQPLQALFARCGTLTADGRPFFLALEIKEASAATQDSLLTLLGRYRTLLDARPTTSSGAPALTAVLVGWHSPAGPSLAAVDSLLGRQHRLTNARSRTISDARVRLLTVDYGKTMGRWWVTDAQRRRWLAALQAAKATAPARLLRVHNVPADAGIYAALLAAGVDLIGTTRLSETARLLGVPATAP